LSILTEPGSGSDNIKLNTKKEEDSSEVQSDKCRRSSRVERKVKAGNTSKISKNQKNMKKRKNRYIQNKMFNEDTNRFYRHLGTKA
jgi:hypothetical protein